MGCQSSSQVSNTKYRVNPCLIIQEDSHQCPNPERSNPLLQSIAHYQLLFTSCSDMLLDEQIDGLGQPQQTLGLSQGEIEKKWRDGVKDGTIRGHPMDALSVCLGLLPNGHHYTKWYEQMLDRHPTGHQLHYGMGNLYYSCQDWQTAEYYYKKSIEIRPDFYHGYLAIANIYCYHLDDTEMAKEWAQMAIKLDKKNKGAHLILAFAMERLPDRIAKLKTVIGLHPQYSRAHNALGWAYHQQHNHQAALHCFTLSQQVSPNYYAPLCGLAQTHLALEESKQAQSWAQKAVEVCETHHEPYLSLAEVLSYRGDHQSAEMYLKKALKITSQADLIQSELCLLRLKMGKTLKQTEEQLNMILELHPGYLHCKEALGRVHLMASKYEEGQSLLEEIVAVHPGYLRLMELLAEHYAERGKKQLAIKHLQNCLVDNPNYYPLLSALQQLR